RLYGRAMPAIVADARAARTTEDAASRMPPEAFSAFHVERPSDASPDGEPDDDVSHDETDRGGAAYLETVPYVRVDRAGIDPSTWIAAGAANDASSSASSAAASPASRLVERIRAASFGYESAGCWLEALVGGTDDGSLDCADATDADL